MANKGNTADAILSLPAHALSYEAVSEQIGADTENGLSAGEATCRLEKCGRNELDDGPGVQPVKILIHQVANAMMLVSPLQHFRESLSDVKIKVLILAMAVSFGISSYIEGGVVAAVIVLNIIIGFNQEFHAEKNMDSLRSLSSPTASAVRDGSIKVVPTAEIVPGDMVELKTGDTVPADIRYPKMILLGS